MGKKVKDAAHAALWESANRAGHEAAAAHTPTPMIVQERASALDDSSPVVREYAPVMGGVCGFGWIQLRPGTSSFARWVKERGLGRADSYAGGVVIWAPREFGQSMTTKLAWAEGAASILREAGLKAHGMSRMD